jgi:predicted nucleic acid-binding protein
VIVVSNASPLISLAKVGCLNLLPDMFGQISIAREVLQEVVGAGGDRPGANAIQNAPWIQVQAVKDTAQIQVWRRTYRLGAGELATVQLAQELSADLAIIDERAARLLAGQYGVKVIGCVGLLETCHRQGRLVDLRATYRQLLAQGVHIDREILNRSLAALNLPSL